MTWALVITGWLLLAILVAAALALTLRGRSLFNPEPEPRTGASTPAGQAREGLRISVLVAEDDDLLRELLLGLLHTDARFRQVHSAADGHQAWTLARREHPDVLLLDVQMPIMTGLDLLPLLHQLRPEPAVMLYTADPSAPTVRAAAQYHPHYLAKSTPLDAVIDEVAALGTTHRRSRQHRPRAIPTRHRPPTMNHEVDPAWLTTPSGPRPPGKSATVCGWRAQSVVARPLLFGTGRVATILGRDHASDPQPLLAHLAATARDFHHGHRHGR